MVGWMGGWKINRYILMLVEMPSCFLFCFVRATWFCVDVFRHGSMW